MKWQRSPGSSLGAPATAMCHYSLSQASFCSTRARRHFCAHNLVFVLWSTPSLPWPVSYIQRLYTAPARGVVVFRPPVAAADRHHTVQNRGQGQAGELLCAPLQWQWPGSEMCEWQAALDSPRTPLTSQLVFSVLYVHSNVKEINLTIPYPWYRHAIREYNSLRL